MSSHKKFDQQLELLKKVSGKLYNRDYLLTWEQDLDTITATVELARMLSELHREGTDLRAFRSGLGVSIFRDNSTRTRFSYASATNLLGLQGMDLDETKSQIAHGETVRETAAMISFLTEAIGIRDDMYIHEGHSYMTEVGRALDDAYENKVLAQRPAVINLQCDMDHPTQSMADLSHLVGMFGGLDQLRGKRIAMTWAYSPSYGKPLSVAQGIIGLMTRFGADVVLAHPEGYNVMPEVLELSGKQAQASGGRFSQTHSMEEAFRDADVVYPKSWAPMAVMEERTRLLRAGENAALKDLEKSALAQNASHKDWECNDKMMKLTKGGDALYMHCLPADISNVSCPQGEVSADVFEKYRLRTYHEASYKPFVIAAMILMTRFERVDHVIRHLLEKDKSRHVK
ncbi:knotted carbamoyltransferase YgeW [Myxococcota bacterium]|nr:knotted carbamoyltransferase YgeW [Myxococcota bacterium]